MFSNYVKVALRNIIRHKGYSFINIVGLAVGMACSLLVFLYVSNELTYDTYHQDPDRIFRIASKKQSGETEILFAGCSRMLAPILKDNFPEVESVFKLSRQRPSIVRRDTVAWLEESIHRTDDGIFKVLTVPFLAGNPESALNRPRTAVLTENIARKYFGKENPIGKTLRVDTIQYEVTGVTVNPPSNTHIKYSILCSSSSFSIEPWMRRWISSVTPTYVKLRPGVRPSEFETKIKDIAHQYGAEELAERGEHISYFLQPIADIHLHSNLRWELEPPGNPTYVYGVAGAGLLVLLMACLNFVNLNTARSTRRICEVGVRKAVGASRGQLFRQFVGESVILAALALTVALVMVDLALPVFGDLTSTQLSRQALLQPGTVLFILGSMLLIGFLAGSCPAAYLSLVGPVRALQGKLTGGSRRAFMRRVLVVGQFIICGVLITSIITIGRQLEHMRSYQLGFDKGQKLVIELPVNAANEANYQSIKAEFLRHSSVASGTISSSLPGRGHYTWRTYLVGKEVQNTQRVNWYQVDGDFMNVYRLEIVAGRAFRSDGEGETWGSLIINETAVRALGIESVEKAIGQHLWREEQTIIGVARDFHFRGLQTEVEPLGMYLIEDDHRYLSLTVSMDRLDETIGFLEAKFNKLFPDGLFSYFFLDADFDGQYQAEKRLSRQFFALSSLGVFIACLGLFGLTAYMAEQRTKEIGIRKVCGASAVRIARLLTLEIVILVAVANVVAWPIAYYIADRWLANFAYHVEIGIGTFMLAGVTALLIALLTVSYQSVKAARANPVEALRYE